jgi:ribonuclease P protein component
MIGRTHRFHGYGSLRGVYQRGVTARAQGVSLKYANRSAAKPYRVAVVVSRKVSKSAVTRNRIRRRVYEIVRTNDQRITPGTDLVFTVFDDALATMEASKLEASISGLLTKAVHPRT